MFKNIVVLDDTGINSESKIKLHQFAQEVDIYDDRPDESETIKRIGDADGVLVSLNTPITRKIMDACPNIRYIGMSCSIIDEKSCNVDISTAKEKGIVVTGIYDYGDNGVVEFLISELVRLLHGFGGKLWKDQPYEFTNLKMGIIGLGTAGYMVAKAFDFLGADVYYYSRTRKNHAEEEGIKYLPLDELLKTVEIVSTHLPRHTCLLNEREFDIFGNNKILLNTSLGPVFSVPALKKWLTNSKNFYICDKDGMGLYMDELGHLPNVIVGYKSAGATTEMVKRRSKKVLENIEKFLEENK